MFTNLLNNRRIRRAIVSSTLLVATIISLSAPLAIAQEKPKDPATPTTPQTTSKPPPLDKTKYNWEKCQPGEVKQDVWGIPTWYKYLPAQKDPATKTCVPFGGESFDPSKIDALAGIGLAVIEILLRLVVFVTIIFVTYGGFLYLTSQGEPDRTKNAKETILNALIGLVIAMLATVLVNFIGRSLA